MSKEISSTANPIEIRPQTITCASHGEHLRAEWPRGYGFIGLRLFEAAIAKPRLISAARKYTPLRRRPGADEINRVLAKTPCCYYVTRDEIRDIFTEADILVKQRCDLCGVVRLAGPYDIGYPDGSRKTEIVCIECMLDSGDREHAAYPKGPPPRG